MLSRKSKWEQILQESVKSDMKKKFLKIAVAAIALAVFGSLRVVGISAQQNEGKSSTPSLSTNWIGFVVFGKEESLDKITRQAYPTADRQVEIGLRSDGIVVWRRTPKMN